jgi:hypothetical protein
MSISTKLSTTLSTSKVKVKRGLPTLSPKLLPDPSELIRMWSSAGVFSPALIGAAVMPLPVARSRSPPVQLVRQAEL